jgi:Fe2+ or Zn2+ uptake regulation protein
MILVKKSLKTSRSFIIYRWRMDHKIRCGKIMIKTLINKERQSIIGIDSDIWYKYVYNADYRRIIKILSNRPLTIDEIHTCYNQNEESNPKSKSTIYRYINDLLKVEVLINAGRVFHSQHTSSKVLYDLSAELLIPEPPKIKIWSSNTSGENLALCLGLILDRHFSHKIPSVPMLKALFHQFETERYHFLKNTLTELVERSKSDNEKKKFIRTIYSSDPYIITQSFELFSLFHWIMQKKDLNCILDKLSACYLESDSTGITQDYRSETSTNNSSDSDLSYSDYIEYTPLLVQTIEQETWDKIVWNYNHRAILLLLRKPMTLSEIHKKHYNAVLARIEEDKKVGKKIPYTPRKKKKSTVYNYLKIMKNGGLIVEAGRRIREGKALTEILYARKALYISKEKPIGEFKSTNWNEIVAIVGSLLVQANSKRDFDHQKLYSIITNMEEFKTKIYTEDYSKAITNPPIEITANFEFEQHNVFFEAVRLVEWFLALKDKQAFKTELVSCFLD